MRNKDILIAVGAIIFYNVISPVIATAGELAQTWMNVKIGKLGVEINKIAAENQSQGGTVNAVGFQIPTEEENDYGAGE